MFERRTKWRYYDFRLIVILLSQAVQCDRVFYYYDKDNIADRVFPDVPSNQAMETGLESVGFLPIESIPSLSLQSDWPSLEAYEHLGKVSAVAPVDDSASTILVLNREDRSWNDKTFDDKNRYLQREFGPIRNGVVVRLVHGIFNGSYLQNTLYLPHGITVDHQGNVWITDVAMHQVFKFGRDLNSKPLLVLGEAFVPGKDAHHFCKPTHVVVQRNGDFFVSDGYCNNRIMKFNANGTLINQWGGNSEYRSSLDPFDLNLPHQLALLEDKNLLCVADRENRRVVCYRTGVKEPEQPALEQLEYNFEIPFFEFGPVYGVSIAPKERILFALVGEEQSGFPVAVHVFRLEPLRSLGIIHTDQDGFGYAHTIASCSSYTHPGCLLVCNLDPATIKLNHHGIGLRRRLWLYRFTARE